MKVKTIPANTLEFEDVKGAIKYFEKNPQILLVDLKETELPSVVEQALLKHFKTCKQAIFVLPKDQKSQKSWTTEFFKKLISTTNFMSWLVNLHCYEVLPVIDGYINFIADSYDEKHNDFVMQFIKNFYINFGSDDIFQRMIKLALYSFNTFTNKVPRTHLPTVNNVVEKLKLKDTCFLKNRAALPALFLAVLACCVEATEQHDKRLLPDILSNIGRMMVKVIGDDRKQAQVEIFAELFSCESIYFRAMLVAYFCHDFMLPDKYLCAFADEKIRAELQQEVGAELGLECHIELASYMRGFCVGLLKKMTGDVKKKGASAATVQDKEHFVELEKLVCLAGTLMTKMTSFLSGEKARFSTPKKIEINNQTIKSEATTVEETKNFLSKAGVDPVFQTLLDLQRLVSFRIGKKSFCFKILPVLSKDDAQVLFIRDFLVWIFNQNICSENRLLKDFAVKICNQQACTHTILDGIMQAFLHCVPNNSLQMPPFSLTVNLGSNNELLFTLTEMVFMRDAETQKVYFMGILKSMVGVASVQADNSFKFVFRSLIFGFSEHLQELFVNGSDYQKVKVFLDGCVKKGLPSTEEIKATLGKMDQKKACLIM